MAERKFDYNEVASIYKTMNDINLKIKDTLSNINQKVNDYVDEPGMAIYGPLGKQLRLDWDNTSSAFPVFVDKFGDWSALIAKSSGNYEEFEKAVAGFNGEHALGPAGPATGTDGSAAPYVSSTYYSDYLEENKLSPDGTSTDINAGIIIPGSDGPTIPVGVGSEIPVGIGGYDSSPYLTMQQN